MTCPSSEKVWLEPRKSHPPKLFLCYLNRLTIPCVSYITPEWKADIGVHVFCLLWEQQDCFYEALSIDILIVLIWAKFPQQWCFQVTFFLVQWLKPIIPCPTKPRNTTEHIGQYQPRFMEWIHEWVVDSFSILLFVSCMYICFNHLRWRKMKIQTGSIPRAVYNLIRYHFLIVLVRQRDDEIRNVYKSLSLWRKDAETSCPRVTGWIFHRVRGLSPTPTTIH